MRYNKYILLLIGCLFFTSCFKVKSFDSSSKPINHLQFDSLLRKYINAAGEVNYKGFIADSVLFKSYLKALSAHHPNEKIWTRNEQMAYWINAYNAFTIKLICDHYPIASIKDVKRGIPLVSDTWAINFINIEGKTYNLNNIEHGILRPQFNDPRIHAAVNCASKSCPKLRNSAYTAENLDAQLTEQMRAFINDPLRNHILSSQSAEVSKIFSWFSGDFTKAQPTVIDFINIYSAKKLNKNAKISHLDYDWSLNDVKQIK